MNLNKSMNTDIFTVLADPTRRLILEILCDQDQTVGELVDILNIRQSGVSRHLSILHNAGLVASQKVAQKHVYSLRAEPLQELEKWLDRYRALWDSRFKKLADHLNINKKVKSYEWKKEACS